MVFGADHIYRMDPLQMLEQHIATGAGVTVAGIRVPTPTSRPVRGDRAPDGGSAIRSFLEKPADGRPACPTPPTRCSRPWATTSSRPTCCSTPCTRTPPTRTPATTWAATSSPVLSAGGGPRLRLRRQPGPGRHRARPRVLAGRGDARQLLRGQHGPGRRCTRSSTSTTGEWPIYTADPRSCRRPSSSSRTQAGRPGARLDRRRRGDHLGWHRPPVGDLPRGVRSSPAPSSRTR